MGTNNPTRWRGGAIRDVQWASWYEREQTDMKKAHHCDGPETDSRVMLFDFAEERFHVHRRFRRLKRGNDRTNGI